MKYKPLIISGLITILFLLMLWWLTGKPLANYLSPNKPLVNSEILLLEGWLSKSELQYAADEYKHGNYSLIITSGIALNREYTLGKNGCLEFRFIPSIKLATQTSLKVLARESLPLQDTARFNVYINDVIIGSGIVGTSPGVITFPVHSIDSVGSISICFLNDALSAEMDINLLVTSVTLNDEVFTVNDTNVYYRVMTWDDSTVYRSAPCGSTVARNVLIEKGISSKQIIDICTDDIDVSRTASTANNTMDSIYSIFNGRPDLGINIMSVSPHSRRTYLAYKRTAPYCNFGIITIRNNNEWNLKPGRASNLKELIGIVFLVLTPARR